jgi:Ni,Fe-hydrogenase maturation factor
MERNVLKERLMNKDDKNRHFVLLIIDISKYGAKEMGHIKMARPSFVPKKITNKQEPKPLFSLE